jgi:hypothetical protein
MNRYQLVTLVDITNSNTSRSETDTLRLGQRANFNSLLQAIGLRANPTWEVDPAMHDGRLPDNLDGKANYWIWEFECERDMVFDDGQSSVGLLINDLHGVPIVNGLNNSIELDPAAFVTKGPKINTWIAEIKNLE